MAIFGSKKGSDDWLRFRNSEKPAESLSKRLTEEQRKRRAAEKEATRWKAKYLEVKEELNKVKEI